MTEISLLDELTLQIDWNSTFHLYQTIKDQEVSMWAEVWVSEVSFHGDVLCTHNLTTLWNYSGRRVLHRLSNKGYNLSALRMTTYEFISLSDVPKHPRDEFNTLMLISWCFFSERITCYPPEAPEVCWCENVLWSQSFERSFRAHAWKEYASLGLCFASLPVNVLETTELQREWVRHGVRLKDTQGKTTAEWHCGPGKQSRREQVSSH